LLFKTIGIIQTVVLGFVISVRFARRFPRFGRQKDVLKRQTHDYVQKNGDVSSRDSVFPYIVWCVLMMKRTTIIKRVAAAGCGAPLIGQTTTSSFSIKTGCLHETQGIFA
jgi:hypothetical protein